MAKDFDRTDEWAPDSSLPAELPGREYTLADGSLLNICINDWLDVDPNGLEPDQYWGSSKQVCELSDNEVIVRHYIKEIDLFQPIALSPEWILGNFRLVETS